MPGSETMGFQSPFGSADTTRMTISSDTTTDLESTPLVRDDTFWRPARAEAPQDWLGYLGLEDDHEVGAVDCAVPVAFAPAPADPSGAWEAHTDDILPGR